MESLEVQKAKKDLQDFLKANPNMVKYQKELEVSLSGINDPVLRLQAILGKISSNMSKIGRLSKEILEVSNGCGFKEE